MKLTKKQQKLIVINRILNEKFKNILPYQLKNIILQENRLNTEKFHCKNILFKDIYSNSINITLYKNMLVILFKKTLYYYEENIKLIKKIRIDEFINCLFAYDKYLVLLVNTDALGRDIIIFMEDDKILRKFEISSIILTNFIEYNGLLIFFDCNAMMYKYNNQFELQEIITTNIIEKISYPMGQLLNYDNIIVIHTYYGIYSKKIFLIDSNGNLLKTINTYYNIYYMMVYDEHLVFNKNDKMIFWKDRIIKSKKSNAKFIGIYNNAIVSFYEKNLILYKRKQSVLKHYHHEDEYCHKILEFNDKLLIVCITGIYEQLQVWEDDS